MLAAVSAAQTDRVPVDCSVTPETGSVLQGKYDVTAIHCDDRPGFFVPHLRYIELRHAEDLLPLETEEKKILQEKATELSLAVDSLTATSSAAETEIEAYKRLYELQTKALWAAEERAQRAWYDHPGVWMFVGAAAVIVVTISISTLLPDRVLVPQ